MIEDHGKVRGLFITARLTQQFPKHIAETLHGTDRQPIGLARERRQRMISAENIA